MTLTLSLVDVTLVLALVALGIALLVYLMLRQEISQIKTTSRELDARALVQEFSLRLKRLEERLVDQRVKFEILELRQQRQSDGVSTRSVTSTSGTPSATLSSVSVAPERQNNETPERSGSVSPRSLSEGSRLPDDTVLVRSEVEALRFVLESGAKGAVAKDIQARIGRSREHTARMMNVLFKEGLVMRNSETRPFSYTITERGKQLVKG